MGNKHSQSFARDELRKKGMQVYTKNGDVSGAIRKFKKRVQEEGVVQEFRQRKEFINQVKFASVKKQQDVLDTLRS